MEEAKDERIAALEMQVTELKAKLGPAAPDDREPFAGTASPSPRAAAGQEPEPEGGGPSTPRALTLSPTSSRSRLHSGGSTDSSIGRQGSSVRLAAGSDLGRASSRGRLNSGGSESLHRTSTLWEWGDTPLESASSAEKQRWSLQLRDIDRKKRVVESKVDPAD